MELNQVNALVAEYLVKGKLRSYEVSKDGNVTRFAIQHNEFEGLFSFGHASQKFALLGFKNLNDGDRTWFGYDEVTAVDTFDMVVAKFFEAIELETVPTDATE